MCVVSMVSDHYLDKWGQKPWYPGTDIWPTTTPVPFPTDRIWPENPPVSREEFEEMKRELEDLKSLLKRAKQYDIDNNEPDCEIDKKVDILKKIGELFGVEIDIKNI